MSANRIEKVNSLLEHEIGNIIQKEISFPDGSITTLTRVETTPNLIEAKAYISTYPEEKSEEAMKILNKDIFNIQKEINKKLNMRPIPKIIFVKDKISVKAERVEEILNRLKKEGK